MGKVGAYDAETFDGSIDWSYGPCANRLGSFYCTHISGVQPLPNGNTQVTMGPQGIVLEVTPDKQEVWRSVSPAIDARRGDYVDNTAVTFVRQGEHRHKNVNASLFNVRRWPLDFAGFEGKDLAPGRYLEA